jgi:hypothetical protein
MLGSTSTARGLASSISAADTRKESASIAKTHAEPAPW